ncbi:MAG: AAA family ATPase [Ruminiclostridium sp.]|nr:AAA family ATPase [Ruminiclostridium sp.]
MLLTLRNIGKIEDAVIELNSITVIAGENNTGKSTVGKVLYSIFNSFYMIENKIKRERIDSISRILDLLYRYVTNRITSRVDTEEIARSIIKNVDEYSRTPEILKKLVYDVRRKVFDSVLIFTDIVGQGISSTRSHMDYILVYNEDKNIDADVDTAVTVQSSGARDEIKKSFMELGESNYIKYGLEMFKNYCFNNVYTYTKEEFENTFVKKTSPI